ncbi:hypothetical protein BP5796_01321 [Coleophoma crateriformis]|uniref:SUN-domain-containing protein n=1 Tax=Coleophoma crateriformis TaxID=565419 RepID=A0A3D8T024_9HELO|nr:hypothetical protein BP5796_01321 [Coleophoma crateriformis]
MKLLDIQAAIGTAMLVLSVPCTAKHGSHNLEILEKKHAHKRHHPSPRADAHLVEEKIEKRGTCQFPSDLGLVSVTPGEQNAGWAMSPDQPCTPGSYCPYACPCGKVSMQWDPAATSYPSMNGGLHCDSNGQIQKPISAHPYCADGVGTIEAVNQASSSVAICQTVLPGNEAMLIPTEVGPGSTQNLAIPDTSYWLSTAAHFYINAPGVSVTEGCVWGDQSKPVGNWSPYVAGGNKASDSFTYFKLGWNPIYTDDSSWKNIMPTFGARITCDDNAGCVGLPCEINPSSISEVNDIHALIPAIGAGDASFCVVTVPEGKTAKLEIFEVGGSSSGSSSKAAPTTTPSPTPTPTPTPTSTSTSSSSTSTSTSTSSTSSSSTSSLSSSSSSSFSSTTFSSSSRHSYSTTSLSSSSAAYPTADNSPHIMFEINGTASVTAKTSKAASGAVFLETSSSAAPSASASATKKSAAASNYASGVGACLGLVLAFAVFFL